MLKRYSRFLARRPRIIALKIALCHQEPPATPKVYTRFGVEDDDRYIAKQSSTILKNPRFVEDENFAGIVTPVQMAENLLVDLEASDQLTTDRPLAKILPWVPCVFLNKITAEKNTKSLTDFISNGGWSNWLKSIDNLFESRNMNAYYLLVAVKWIVKLHKLLIDMKKLDNQELVVDDISNLTDATRLISWLSFIFSGSEQLNIAHITTLVNATCYIVDNLNETVLKNGQDDRCRSLIDNNLKVAIRKNLIRIYNAFKMDRQCRQRSPDEIKPFASAFYRIFCRLRVFDQKFFDDDAGARKIDDHFLKENNLVDIYEFESYSAALDMIKAKLIDDFVQLSAYMSKVRHPNSQFSELVYLMQFGELVNLFDLIDNDEKSSDNPETRWADLFLFRMKVFASSYFGRTNLTSASILRLFLLISLKNGRLNVFNQFKKNYFEGKFRENLPFLTDEQLTEMKAVVQDKLNVNLDSLYK